MPSLTTPRLLVVLGVAVLLAGACGDEGGSSDTTATAGATTTTAGPTTTGAPSLSVTVEGLTGFRGRLVLGLLFPADGDTAAPVGSVCLPIDADPWTGSGALSTAAPDNPCGKEPPYGEVISTEGEYSLIVGVYTPGESTPVVCVETTATIAGPSRVTVSAADLTPDCMG